jgi:hypothetical protein
VSDDQADTEVYWKAMEFNIGRTLKRTFDVLGHNAATFLLIVAIVDAPNLYFMLANAQHVPGTNPTVPLLASAYAIVATSFSTALIVSGAFAYLCGRPVSLSMSVQHGLWWLVPVLLTSICVGVGVTVGLILFVIPGIVVAVMTVCALPACVVERLGPFGSISRSAALTKGYRWGIFGAIGVSALVSLIATSVIPLVPFPEAQAVALHAFLQYVQTVVISTFNAVLSVIIYHDLRIAKDGISSEELAAAFD